MSPRLFMSVLLPCLLLAGEARAQESLVNMNTTINGIGFGFTTFSESFLGMQGVEPELLPCAIRQQDEAEAAIASFRRSFGSLRLARVEMVMDSSDKNVTGAPGLSSTVVTTFLRLKIAVRAGNGVCDIVPRADVLQRLRQWKTVQDQTDRLSESFERSAQ